MQKGKRKITCVLNNIVSICVLFKFSSSSSFGHRLMGHSKRMEVNYAQFLFLVSGSCNICFFALCLLASEQSSPMFSNHKTLYKPAKRSRVARSTRHECLWLYNCFYAVRGCQQRANCCYQPIHGRLFSLGQLIIQGSSAQLWNVK